MTHARSNAYSARGNLNVSLNLGVVVSEVVKKTLSLLLCCINDLSDLVTTKA